MKNLQMFPGSQMKMSNAKFLYLDRISGDQELGVERAETEKKGVLEATGNQLKEVGRSTNQICFLVPQQQRFLLDDRLY